jgi:hypothetical protein
MVAQSPKFNVIQGQPEARFGNKSMTKLCLCIPYLSIVSRKCVAAHFVFRFVTSF